MGTGLLETAAAEQEVLLVPGDSRSAVHSAATSGERAEAQAWPPESLRTISGGWPVGGAGSKWKAVFQSCCS